MYNIELNWWRRSRSVSFKNSHRHIHTFILREHYAIRRRRRRIRACELRSCSSLGTSSERALEVNAPVHAPPVCGHSPQLNALAAAAAIARAHQRRNDLECAVGCALAAKRASSGFTATLRPIALWRLRRVRTHSSALKCIETATERQTNVRKTENDNVYVGKITITIVEENYCVIIVVQTNKISQN